MEPTHTASIGQRLQVAVKVRFVDLVEVTAANGIDADLELRAQRLELVLLPALRSWRDGSQIAALAF